MKKALSIFSSKQHRIAVVQYERADYSVGAEEELHWAIIVITDTTYQTGPAFQAIDRHYTNTQEVVWSLFAKDVNLGSTRKCLGGVYVGTVKASDLESLHQTLCNNNPVPKSPTWNCRDWVMEGIQLLKSNGWVQADIPSQGTLLPSLKRASKDTKVAHAKRGVPVIVELE